MWSDLANFNLIDSRFFDWRLRFLTLTFWVVSTILCFTLNDCIRVKAGVFILLYSWRMFVFFTGRGDGRGQDARPLVCECERFWAIILHVFRASSILMVALFRYVAVPPHGGTTRLR